MIRTIFLGCIIFLNLIISSPSARCQIELWEEQVKTEPENRQLLMELGRYWHNIGGMEENKEAVIKAVYYLENLIELDKKNGLALVYCGSAKTMKARDAVFIWDKISYVKKGINLMDKAVQLEPDNPEIRLVRGANAATMPKIMRRVSIALADFKHIEKLNSEEQLNFPASYWLLYYYNYGLALYNNHQYEEAKVKYKKAIEVDPNSDYAGYARRELKKIEEKSDEK